MGQFSISVLRINTRKVYFDVAAEASPPTDEGPIPN